MQGSPQWTRVRARSEHVLLRLLIAIRAVTLCQAAVLLTLSWRALTVPAVAVVLLCLLTANNVVLFAVYLRRGAPRGRLITTFDAWLGIAGLVVVTILLKPSANPRTDEFLYPYTVASMCVCGMVYRSPIVPLLTATLAAAGFLVTTIARFDPVSLAGLMADSYSYWAWVLGSWLLATLFRRMSAELDEARSADAERECDVSRWRERVKLSRELHDRILQTLEVLSRDNSIGDVRLRDRLASETRWLRNLILAGVDDPSVSLAAALNHAVAQQTSAGMRIDLNTARLASEVLPSEVVDALGSAVRELLTNVRKHSGTAHATLRAVALADEIEITVLDHGCGFDPVQATPGLGLRESVIARLREIGGAAVIWSEPGEGTHVRLSVPYPAPAMVSGAPHSKP